MAEDVITSRRVEIGDIAARATKEAVLDLGWPSIEADLNRMVDRELTHRGIDPKLVMRSTRFDRTRDEYVVRPLPDYIYVYQPRNIFHTTPGDTP